MKTSTGKTTNVAPKAEVRGKGQGAHALPAQASVILLSQKGTRHPAATQRPDGVSHGWGPMVADLLELFSIPDIQVPPTAFIPLPVAPAGGWAKTIADKKALGNAIQGLQASTGKIIGDPVHPLVLQVSLTFSAQTRHVPVLSNVGLSRRQVMRLCTKYREEATFWLESYCRFLVHWARLFRDIVVTTDPDPVREALLKLAPSGMGPFAEGVTEKSLWALADRLEDILRSFKWPVESLPLQQITHAVESLLQSAQVSELRVVNPKEAVTTGIVLQEMVFGNRSRQSGSGVLLTRDLGTGEQPKNKLVGRMAFGSQGEDLRFGRTVGMPLEAVRDHPDKRVAGAYGRLKRLADHLERRRRDMVMVPFVLQESASGRVDLWITGISSPARSPLAESALAAGLTAKGLMKPQEAVTRVDPLRFRLQCAARVGRDARSKALLLSKGTPASPGVATGEIAFDPADALAAAQQGKDVVLFAGHAGPTLDQSLSQCVALVTTSGWEAAPAAQAALASGIPAVVGAREIDLGRDVAGYFANLGGCTLRKGDLITVDGEKGEIFAGRVEKTMASKPDPASLQVLRWAQGLKKIEIRANTEDTEQAIENWADGIGLVRTEHIFLGAPLDAAKDLVFGKDGIRKKRAVAAIHDATATQLLGLMDKMNKRGVMIRLLDAPLQDFMPYGVDFEREANPRMGHRGVRLALTNQETIEVQAKAILCAVAQLRAKGKMPIAEIMIPMVTFPEEVTEVKRIVAGAAARAKADVGTWPAYSLGVLVETPACALMGEGIVKALERPVEDCPKQCQPRAYFACVSLKTLVQFALGLSAEDGDAFLRVYLDRGYLSEHPFQRLSSPIEGLIQQFAEAARRADPGLPIYLLGEDGGCSDLVALACQQGLAGVCISPSQIPCAILQAAQCVVSTEA